MSPAEKTVKQFRAKLARFLILKQAFNLFTVWAFVWGTAVLALRAGAGLSQLTLLWGLAGVPIILGFAIYLGLRHLPNPRAVRALLDRRGNCGGLLMAAGELNLGGWQASLATLETPHIQWHRARAFSLLTCALAFLLVGFLLPQPMVSLSYGSSLEIGREAAKLTEKIAVLKEEKILERERADSLQQKLDQVRADASGRDPVKTLEALDHLEDVVQKAARQAADSGARKLEKLAKAESLAESLQNQPGGAGKDDVKFLSDALAENDLLQKLDQQIADALQGDTLTPQQLAQLAEALKDGRDGILNQLKNLCQCNLIDGDTLKKCEGMCASNGGIDRGRGDADLTFGEETDPEGARFKSEVLPPSSVSALKDSKLTGLSQATPKSDPDAGPSQSGALAGATAGGGSAVTQVILPRHRGAVDRYFDRPTK